MLRARNQSQSQFLSCLSRTFDGDWLLVPSSVALAGAWIVWLACDAGFFWLRGATPAQPDMGWSHLGVSLLVGALAASPFFCTALVFRRIGWTRC